jgi:predicted nucleic acid-binding protein
VLNTVLVDAGPLIALFDKSDKYHKRIKEFVAGKQFKFISTIAVFTEVLHMLDFNIHVQIDFLEWIMNKGLVLFEVHYQDIPRIIELTKKYSDLPMDFADATLVVAAEKMGVKKIISIDADFEIYRLPGKVKIKNIFSN